MNRGRGLMRGFTLLELVVVVAVLALVANLATEHLVQVTDQQRYETSRDRLEKLRYAIVGDDSRTINGQPDLFGFVHDMGRRPVELSELYLQPTDCDLGRDGDQPCPATYDASLGRTVGWRGPYISERDARKDGWGNAWHYDPDAGRILSLGADGVSGGEGYSADQVATIQQADQASADAVRVTLTAPIKGVCLTATHVRNGVPVTVVSPSTLLAPTPGDYDFAFEQDLPIGRLALDLREYGGGDCVSAPRLAAWSTTVYPRRTLQSFRM